MAEVDKKQARELLIKAKVYRLFATVFAVVGAVIFLVLYFRFYGGDFMEALRDPTTIFIVIFPFLPAVLLSLKAKRAEKALHKLLSPDE
jgi:hypothetical protein